MKSAVAFCFLLGCSSPTEAGPTAPDTGEAVDVAVNDTTVTDSTTPPDSGSPVVDTAVADSIIAKDSPVADTGGPSFDAPDDAPVSCTAPTVYPTVTLSGSPSWQVGEVIAYKASIGDGTSVSMFTSVISSIVNPNHVDDPAKNLFKSGTVHAPPFDTELMTGLKKTSLVNSGCFALSDLTAPSGIIVSMMLVPSAAATMGKSYEQPMGAPIAVRGDLIVDGNLFVDGALTDSLFDSTMPKAVFAHDYPMDRTIDGWGHALLNFGENQAVTEKPLKAGDYRLEVILSGEAGKTLTQVRFSVK